jgi:hypothetical protein
VYNLRPPQEARAIGPSFLGPMAIVIPWILNFCKILHSFENGAESPTYPLTEERQECAPSFVQRLGAADERTAPNIKSQHPVRIPRNADPDALPDFALADFARLPVIAREP